MTPVNCVSSLKCCMLFANKHTKHIIARSQLNHTSLSKWSTLCTRQDLGKERSTMQYVTLTLDVYQVCHSVSSCVKIGPVLRQAWVNINGECCLDIFYCLNKCEMILNMSLMTILFFSNTMNRCVLRSTQSHYCSTKLSTSFLLSYGPVTVQNLASLTAGFMKSYIVSNTTG